MFRALERPQKRQHTTSGGGLDKLFWLFDFALNKFTLHYKIETGTFSGPFAIDIARRVWNVCAIFFPLYVPVGLFIFFLALSICLRFFFFNLYILQFILSFTIEVAVLHTRYSNFGYRVFILNEIHSFYAM